ncbi:MAG: competence type IV pilus minor pilin ComGF [Bacillus sp. (in: firmicutes)]
MRKGMAQSGFTLIEMLVSLMTFILIVSLVIQVLAVVRQHPVESKGLNPMEWELFLLDVKREARLSVSPVAIDDKLAMVQSGRLVSIEQYGTILRRRVNHSGHEILLQNVRDVRFEVASYGIALSVTDLEGQHYSAVLPIYD